MTQAVEELWNFLNETSNLPRFYNLQAFEFVDLVKAHQDEQDGAGVIDDADVPFDRSIRFPELAGPLEFGIWFVVMVCLASVGHGRYLRFVGFSGVVAPAIQRRVKALNTT